MTYDELLRKLWYMPVCDVVMAIESKMDTIEKDTGKRPAWEDEVPVRVLNEFGFYFQKAH